MALLSHACAHRIKHVVVLYEENRAFDHLLGHQKSLKVDGLKGDESNPVDRRDPSKGSVAVFDGAPYVAVRAFGAFLLLRSFEYPRPLSPKGPVIKRSPGEGD